MRILDVAALPGDTMVIDFFLRNVDVLAGYTFRLRYDPSLIEPLTDTTLVGNDTAYWVEAQQLRGTSCETFGGAVRSPGEMVFGAFDLMHAPQSPDTTFFLPGRGVAARLRWRVLPSVTPQMTSIYFENDPVFPQSWNTLVDTSGLIFRRPVLLSGTVTIPQCLCMWHGDLNSDGMGYTIADAVLLIDYMFVNGPAPSRDYSCPRVGRGDMNCDGIVDVIDLVWLLDVGFGSQTLPCNPCVCTPHPGGCP
jgi:hypothetical protein